MLKKRDMWLPRLSSTGLALVSSTRPCLTALAGFSANWLGSGGRRPSPINP